jgi:hypothetical protein
MSKKKAIALMERILADAPHLRTALDIKPIENGIKYVIWLSGINFFIWNEANWDYCWSNPSKYRELGRREA